MLVRPIIQNDYYPNSRLASTINSAWGNLKSKMLDPEASVPKLKAWLDSKRSELGAIDYKWFDRILEATKSKTDIAKAVGFGNTSRGYETMYYLGELIKNNTGASLLNHINGSLRAIFQAPVSMDNSWTSEFFDNLICYLYCKYTLMNRAERN